MLQITILLIAAIINLTLGTVVYFKNRGSITNRFFAMLTTSLVLWSVINYFSVHPIGLSQIWWIRLVLVSAAFLCLSVFFTFEAFPYPVIYQSRKTHKIAPIATLFVGGLALTPLVFSGLKLKNGGASPDVNFGIVFFALLVISLLGSGVVDLIKKYRRFHGRQRAQVKFVIVGLTGCFSLILISNFLLVVLFGYTKLLSLAPAYTLIFSGATAYSIIRYRLFDIRAAAARGLAYLMALGFIGLLYGVLVFTVVDTLAPGSSLTSVQRIFYISFAIVSSLIYQPIKRFFDKVTNHIFFRDAYDPQKVLDQLNRVLVKSIDVDTLTHQSAELLKTVLKASFVKFFLLDRAQGHYRLMGSGTTSLQESRIAELMGKFNDSKVELVVTEELVSEREATLHNQLTDLDIAVCRRLDTHTQHIGYVIMGHKLSGDTYSAQDLALLNIVAGELAIATQNSLRFEEIEHFNMTLQQKVVDATRQLRHSNDRLREMDETKDEFISMASHQLRTPLTSVKGYLSMVLEGDAGKIKPEQAKLLQQAFISSQRMVYLIADLLNVSRLKTGKFIIESTPTNLAEVVDGEVKQLIETAKGRQLNLLYDKPKNFPTLMLDETKIRQVIMNFIDNAIYYTPAGGHIHVNLVETPRTVELLIVDDGIGVPRSEQHHLFTKFFRAGNAKKARPDGTGLGLFMAKKVIVAQGGAIIFKSQEGKGSTFGFSFAKDKHKPKPVEPVAKAPELAVK